MENGRYLLVDGWWGSRVGEGLHRHLMYKANGKQVLHESAGVISPVGVGTLRGNDIRRCLRSEDNARHVPRWGAGVVDSLDSRRGTASCLATVAPSPPSAARRVARQTRMLLFRHGGKTPSSLPPSGELTTVVVAVALRGEEYHVVAAVEGHELETPEAEHGLGLKRLLSRPLPGAPTVGVSDLGFRKPTSKFFVACPCPDGLARDGTQGENAARIISHRGVCS
jgi:hypothetical protein